MAREGDPTGRGGRGISMLMLVILAILVALAVGYAWMESPPDAPNPSATGTPAGVPTR